MMFALRHGIALILAVLMLFTFVFMIKDTSEYTMFEGTIYSYTSRLAQLAIENGGVDSEDVLIIRQDLADELGRLDHRFTETSITINCPPRNSVQIGDRSEVSISAEYHFSDSMIMMFMPERVKRLGTSISFRSAKYTKGLVGTDSDIFLVQ